MSEEQRRKAGCIAGRMQRDFHHGLLQRWRLRGRLVHRAWRYRLRTEAAEVAFLRAHVSAGQVAVDVGAHRGALTYWMLTAVGRTGRVVAVEPIPELAAYLRRLGTEGGFDRLRVVEAALSSASGTTTLHVPSAGYTGTASVVARADGHTPVSVDMTTLDALCARWRPSGCPRGSVARQFRVRAATLTNRSIRRAYR